MSNLEVVEQIAPVELTTREAVKSAFRISGDADDAMLDDLIKVATDEAQRYTERTFARARVLENRVRAENGYLALTLTPIIELHSVMRGGEPILDFEIDDADAGLVTSSTGVMAEGEARWWNDPFYYHGNDVYTVEYTGGYLTPRSDPPDGYNRNLPYDLERAVMEMVNLGYTPGGADDRPLKSIKVEDITYTYEEGQTTSVALAITDRLDRYRRIA
jgi:hypothetical protein